MSSKDVAWRRTPAGPVVVFDDEFLVTVTSREPEDSLWQALNADPEANARAGIMTLQPIGDCKAPGLIAHAVYDRHKAARELGEAEAERDMRRERVVG